MASGSSSNYNTILSGKERSIYTAPAGKLVEGRIYANESNQ